MASDLKQEQDRTWFITRRWQAYGAERRANLLRVVGIGSFYLIHLWSYYSASGWLPDFGFLQIAAAGEVQPSFHIAATLLAVAWSMLALGIYFALEQRFFPQWLPYLSTGADVVLLTAMICLASGPRSPLVVVYFLILVLTALRFDLPLLRFATAGAVLGYVVALGNARWWPTFDKLVSDLRVPRYHQVIVLLAIVLAGVVLDQVVRGTRQVARHFAQRTGEPQPAADGRD